MASLASTVIESWSQRSGDDLIYRSAPVGIARLNRFRDSQLKGSETVDARLAADLMVSHTGQWRVQRLQSLSREVSGWGNDFVKKSSQPQSIILRFDNPPPESTKHSPDFDRFIAEQN